MSHQWRSLLAAGVFTCLAGAASAAVVVDQKNVPDVLQINASTSSLHWQQEVVVGVGGRLQSIDVWGGGGSTSFLLTIHRGNGWQSDGAEYAVLLNTTPNAELTIDLSAAALDFLAGEHFMIGVQGQGGDGNLRGSTGDAYAPGALWLDGSVYFGDDYDLAFRTHVDAAVPEPGSLALLAIGLTAAAGTRLRRRTPR